MAESCYDAIKTRADINTAVKEMRLVNSVFVRL